MRDPKRIPRILSKIEQMWKERPDWRLGQLLENVKRCSGNEDTDTFYVEDEAIEKAMDEFYL